MGRASVGRPLLGRVSVGRKQVIGPGVSGLEPGDFLCTVLAEQHELTSSCVGRAAGVGVQPLGVVEVDVTSSILVSRGV
jgi:hypothetical protein